MSSKHRINPYLENIVHRLKNSDFILESKMVELNENKNSKQADDQMQCENFFDLGSKEIAQVIKLFTQVLQNHCS